MKHKTHFTSLCQRIGQIVFLDLDAVSQEFSGRLWCFWCLSNAVDEIETYHTRFSVPPLTSPRENKSPRNSSPVPQPSSHVRIAWQFFSRVKVESGPVELLTDPSQDGTIILSYLFIEAYLRTRAREHLGEISSNKRKRETLSAGLFAEDKYPNRENSVVI